MARKTPAIRDKKLSLWDHEADRLIMELDITRAGDWPHWQEWLERSSTKSFRYTDSAGRTCTVIKEQRRSFGRDEVFFTAWYAHKRLAGKLRRRYLGRSENLTHERLSQAAAELSRDE